MINTATIDISEYNRLKAQDEIANTHPHTRVWYSNYKNNIEYYYVVSLDKTEGTVVDIIEKLTKELEIVNKKYTAAENNLYTLKNVNYPKVEDGSFKKKRFLFWTYYIKL